MIKAIGTHCYLGGFLLGLQRAGLRVGQSLETWKPGLQGARVLGLNSKETPEIPKKLPKAHIVAANPPCSRFSHLSLSFFNKKHHQDPESFPQIIDLIKIAKAANAKMIWWETGPLAWSLGRDLLANFHDSLYNIWGRVTTLLVRFDLRYIGIPQKRPRIHVIHINSAVKPPSVPQSVWPTKYRVGEWLKNKTAGYKLENPVFLKNVSDPLAWAKKQESEMTFRSMVPKIISEKDWYTGSVVSRRIMIWKEENRFFDLLEYAALMDYPLEKMHNLISVAKKPLNAQVLISKSVAPAASKWVAENIVLPWLKQKKSENLISPATHQRGIWELDLSIPNKIDGMLRSRQRFFQI